MLILRVSGWNKLKLVEIDWNKLKWVENIDKWIFTNETNRDVMLKIGFFDDRTIKYVTNASKSLKKENAAQSCFPTFVQMI